MFKLPPAVYSPQLLDSVTYEIEQYLDWHRANRVRSRAGAKPAEEPTHSAETVLVIEAWLAGKPATVELLENLIATLHKLSLPVVHVTLAALPNHAQRIQLVDWFRVLAGNHQILISFVAERSMGGGAIIRTPNRIFDYSWRHRLIEGRAKLPEIIARAR
jgi:hypothetical protein